MITNKCIRKFQHEWETLWENDTHIVKECWRCKGKNWVARKDDQPSKKGSYVNVADTVEFDLG